MKGSPEDLIATYAGAKIEKTIPTFVIDTNGWTTAAEPGGKKKTYIAWENTHAVQIGHTLVISPIIE